MSTSEPALFTFVKLTVADIDGATRFFEEGFGLTHADTVDTPAFREHMMTGAKGSTTIVLFHWKDRRAIEPGNGYGPVGMISRNFEADLARAIASGAKQKGETVTFGPARIAFVHTPEGHEIEIMQMDSAPTSA